MCLKCELNNISKFGLWQTIILDFENNRFRKSDIKGQNPVKPLGTTY